MWIKLKRSFLRENFIPRFQNSENTPFSMIPGTVGQSALEMQEEQWPMGQYSISILLASVKLKQILA